jgi:predicted metal-dependent HD superfamily phosphohydrolase
VDDLPHQWPLPDRADVRDDLLERYGDPRRGYHDRRHLAEVLDRLGDLMPVAHPSRETVLLAAWFHDAVYEGERDDEERSATLAEDRLHGRPDAAEVGRLVRLTQSHRPGPDDLDGQLLCDADLAILAAAPQRYGEYVAGVRQEYAHVPEQQFRATRRQILTDLLAKATLFHTAAARERWEAAARANLTREVAGLSDLQTEASGA